MPDPSHPVFIGLRDHEWSAISSIATAAAVVVALVVPTAARLLDRRDAAARRKELQLEAAASKARSATQIAEASAQAGAVLMFARGQYNQRRKLGLVGNVGDDGAIVSLHWDAQKRAEQLRVMANQPGLDQRAILIAVGVARAMDALASVGVDRQVESEGAFLQRLERYITISGRQYSRMREEIIDMLLDANVPVDTNRYPFFDEAYDGT